ncbi:MAG: DUF3999 domain-containing protein [Gammaproteobacteria bacterium]|nr:DUF3999 domain-containing protein [Gammaproteobacteria bacterium]
MSLLKTVFLSCFLFCTLTVFAEPTITDPVLDDFAYGSEVLINDSHAFQTLDLPDHYYQTVARLDGQDLGVFNAEGVLLSFSISDNETEQKKTRTQVLPFFPIYGQAGRGLDELSLRIERNAGGTIIDIKEGGKQQTGSKVVAYIIDNSFSHNKNTRGRLFDLEFDWDKPEYGFINNIKLEQSSDLNVWRGVTSNESLSRLAYEGEVIGKQTIAIGTGIDKYLRLSWDEKQDFSLKTITAYYQWSQLKRQLHWQTIDNLIYITDADDEFENGSYQFSVKGHPPVQQFTFKFSDGNAFYRGRLYSRMNADSNWNDRGRFLQYRLQMPGGVVQSESLHLPAVRDSEWLIKFETPKKFQKTGLPVAQLAWYPEQLTFLAQGKPPFILAYGNPRIAQSRTGLSSLLNSLNDEQRKEIAASVATLAAPKELGGLSRLAPEQEKFPWRKVLLWLVLVAGVLVMVKMAVSLFRQMDGEKH